jgi:hypothetical protein
MIVVSLNVLMVLLVLYCILESTGSNIYLKAVNSDKVFPVVLLSPTMQIPGTVSLRNDFTGCLHDLPYCLTH